MSESVTRDASAAKPATTRRAGRSSTPQLIPIAALVLSIVATLLAAYAALRPTGGDASSGAAAGSYDQAQQDDAKATVCTAFDTVRNGVGLNTNAKAPGGAADLTGTLAVAANARLSMLGGGQYLLARLGPATPAELADDVRTFSNQLLDIGAASIAGTQTTDPAQATRLKDAEAMSVRIADECRAA